MTQQSNYFLWLTPAAPALLQLQAIVDALAREYDGPSFEPHITLLSRLHGSVADIGAKIARLAAEIAPLTVRCPTLGWSDAYYRCLYLNVEKDPVLLSVHERSGAEIPHAVRADFQPHISLVYGDLAEETKLSIASSLRDVHPRSLSLDRMSLYHAPGPPETWRLVEAFPLRG